MIGRELDQREQELARWTGVQHPERIRVILAPKLFWLIGLVGFRAIGLALGYRVFVKSRGYQMVRVLSHEFRHVFQYEQLGSFPVFGVQYLWQLFTLGYEASKFEVDAVNHERSSPKLRRKRW